MYYSIHVQKACIYIFRVKIIKLYLRGFERRRFIKYDNFSTSCPLEGPSRAKNPSLITLKTLVLRVMHTKFGQNRARTYNV